MTTQSADAIAAPLVLPIQPAVVIPPDVNETADRLGVAQYLPQVIDLTREVFGTFSRVTVREDPEFLGDDHIVFHVPSQATIDADLDKSEQWGQRLMEIIPRSPQVYLAIPEFRS